MIEHLNKVITSDKYSNTGNPDSELQTCRLKLINNNHSNFQNNKEHDLISCLDDVFEAIVKVNDKGKIIRVNQTFTEIFGYSAENITGTDKEKLLYSDDKGVFEYLVETMISKGKAKGELRLIKKDGSFCHGKVVLMKCIDGEGFYSGYYSFLEDITERVRTEKSLNDAQNFLASTLNSLSENVAIIDENGIIVAINRAWAAFTLQNDGELKKTGIGSNYLAACENAIGKNHRKEKLLQKV